MEDDARTVRSLRALILVIIALCAVAAVLGSRQMRWFIPVYCVPVAIAYGRPRWSQLLIWIMWSATWGMLALFVAIGGRPALFTVPSHWLLASAAALQCIALPLLRWALESGRFGASRLPEARIHRRD